MNPVRTPALMLSLVVGLASAVSCEHDDPDESDEPRYYQGRLCSEQSANDLFERRIAPLLADDRPSSCNECHLSGVDLGMFARETPCETMACLVELDLVDYANPQASRILGFIRQADPQSPLITQEVLDEEYDGFLEWLEFNAACGSQACGNTACGSPHEAFCDTTEEPDEEDVLGAPPPVGCSDKDIEQLFLDSLYSSRGRCSPCHFDNWDRNTIGSPPWIKTGGTCNQASLATLRVIERSGYINIEDPNGSLLLLKALGEEQGGMVHGGGPKLHPGDSAFLNFTRFLQHYSACARGTFDAGSGPVDAGRRDQ